VVRKGEEVIRILLHGPFLLVGGELQGGPTGSKDAQQNGETGRDLLKEDRVEERPSAVKKTLARIAGQANEKEQITATN